MICKFRSFSQRRTNESPKRFKIFDHENPDCCRFQVASTSLFKPDSLSVVSENY